MTDWESVVKRGCESRELDYKGPCAWDAKDKKACCELVKDVLALANTNGGWVILGVSETAEGFCWEGLSASQVKTFDTTRVNQFLQRYADPPLNTTLHKAKVDGKNYVIIEVPHFSDTPHVCQKDYPGVLTSPTIYVRTANNESAPLKSSAAFHAIVERAVRNRSDQLLAALRTILTHGTAPPEPTDEEGYEGQIDGARSKLMALVDARQDYPLRETAFYPNRFSEGRLSIPQVKEMARAGGVSYWGWPFIHVDLGPDGSTYAIQDGLEGFLDRGNEYPQFWQFRQSGLLFTRQGLGMKARRSGDPTLDFEDFSCLVCDAVRTIGAVYDGYVDQDENITLRFSLLNVKDLPFASSNPNRRYSWSPEMWTHCRIDEIPYQACHALAEWKAGTVDHALEVCDYVFERFNARDGGLIAESRKLMEAMLARKH